MTAYVEVHYEDDEKKNQLCGTVAFPATLADYIGATATSMMNQYHWSQDKELRNWIRASRLDGFGKMVSGIDPDDADKQAILARFRNSAKAAAMRMPAMLAMLENIPPELAADR